VEADRRDKKARGPHFFDVAHDWLPWYPRGAFNKHIAKSRGPCESRLSLVGHIKRVCPPRPVLSRLSASSGEPGCIQGKKRAFKPDSKLTTIDSSSCSHNLRLFMHLRLAVLRTEGPKECTRGSLLLLPQLQIVLATDWRASSHGMLYSKQTVVKPTFV
jgi:hypothetical protein